MKFKNENGTMITIIEIDDLGQATYKIESINNCCSYKCFPIESVMNMLKINNYKKF